MFELKPLPVEAFPRALDKADTYRLLNEPWEAESICLDVLAIEPDHQRALRTLLLALTDQFEHGLGEQEARARAVVPRLQNPYEREYYAAIIAERRGKAHLRQGRPGAGPFAYQAFREAMTGYERAEALRTTDSDDPVLRWNACARVLNGHPHLAPGPEPDHLPHFGE